MGLALAAGLLGTGVVAAPSPVAAATFTYACTSALGTTTETYAFRATAPAEVAPGQTFVVDDVVIAGTTELDLLLVSMSISLEDPAGADPVDGLVRTMAGPGATDPPGPYAPAGSTNEGAPESFTFRATGAPGTVVDLVPGTVQVTVAAIDDPSIRLDVTCTRRAGAPVASVRIVAPTTSTSTTAGPGMGVSSQTRTAGTPGPGGADPGGTVTAVPPPAAVPVVAPAALTG